MHAREPASFWQENLIAVVILQRILARIFRGLNLLDINNRINFFGEKSKMKLSGVAFFRTRKNFQLNLVLVVVLVLSLCQAL